MTQEELKTKSKEEIFDFIRERLAFKEDIQSQLRHCGDSSDNYAGYYVTNFNKLEHRRFDMSGYDNHKTGSCTIHNMNIVNEFADLGIYDHTNYLFLDFYKGEPILYYQYYSEELPNFRESLGGMGTVEIIYEILRLTVLWKGPTLPKRRRD
jgi:hypothetical protein